MWDKNRKTALIIIAIIAVISAVFLIRKNIVKRCDNCEKINSILLPVIEETVCGDNVCESSEQNCPQDCADKKSEYAFGVFGAHVRDIHGKWTLDDAIELGNQAARHIIHWWRVEPTQNNFTFDETDQLINMYYEAEIFPVITLKCMSSWGTKTVGGSEDKASSPPKDMESYERFVRTVVDRYKDKVKYWQIENEVFDNTIGPEWAHQFWNGTKEEYLNLLQHAYSAIKQTDSEAKVVLQGFGDLMFRIIDEEDNELAEEAEAFFEYLMNDGSKYFDVIDFHQYYKPEDVYLEIKLLKEAMDKYEYNKELISTEAGDLDIRLFQYLDDPIIKDLLSVNAVDLKFAEIKEEGITDQEKVDFARFLKENALSRPILEKYQAENLVKRASLAFGLGVKQIHWYLMMDKKDPTEMYDVMGLIDSDGRKKPHYYTYQLLIDKLTGFMSADYLNFISYEEIPNEKVIRFTFADKDPVYILWSENPARMDLTSHISTDSVKITHIVTELGADNDPIYPKDETVLTNSIPIGITPIIVERN